MFLEPGRNVFFEKVRNKKFRKIYISNTLLDYFSLKYKEDIFKRKTIGLCDFLKIKYFLSRVQPRARTAKLGQFFGNLKNLEMKKVVNQSTLLYEHRCVASCIFRILRKGSYNL